MKNAFTVVTPNFNMGPYLEETIESVLANLRTGDEYFIVDGGSTDGSVEIIRRYEGRISGWVSERDRGYADALAKGFRRSGTEYQCWINSGDLLLYGALDIARGRLAARDVEMVFGDDLYIGEDGRVLQVTNGKVGNLAAMMLYGGWTPLQDACYWRRSLYEKVGGIDVSQRYAADYDLFLRMSLRGICEYVPVLFSAFRRHEGQTSSRHEKAYQQERLICRQRELNIYASHIGRRVIRTISYWLMLRWRTRMQGKNRALGHLVGRRVADLGCVEYDRGGG